LASKNGSTFILENRLNLQITRGIFSVFSIVGSKRLQQKLLFIQNNEMMGDQAKKHHNGNKHTGDQQEASGEEKDKAGVHRIPANSVNPFGLQGMIFCGQPNTGKNAHGIVGWYEQKVTGQKKNQAQKLLNFRDFILNELRKIQKELRLKADKKKYNHQKTSKKLGGVKKPGRYCGRPKSALPVAQKLVGQKSRGQNG
jgi:hypothetical protein